MTVTAYSYNDIALIPNYSNIESRFGNEISLKTRLMKGNERPSVIGLPIINAPMDTIASAKMVNTINGLGGLGILHRFFKSKKERIEELKKIDGEVILSLGVNEFDFFKEVEKELKVDGVLIDIAHGHSSNLKQMVYKLKDYIGMVIGGSVATYDGTMDLYNWGIDVVRLGVSAGAVCRTRINTGFGIPMIYAIEAGRRAKIDYMGRTGNYVGLIADGGCKFPGDLAKALALGADAVMIGGMLAGTSDCVNPLIYRGQASAEAQLANNGKITSIEGAQKHVEYRGETKTILQQYEANLRSALSYVGAHNLEEFWQKTSYVIQTPNGFIEGTDHF